MKVLFVGAHIDDVEINCGATISRYVREGHDVTCVALSDCDEIGLGILKEFSRSMDILGCTGEVKSFKQRVFSQHRQAILEFLLFLGPFDRVFTHSQNDLHQDHSVVGIESMRAFYGCDILTYCNPRNMGLSANYFVSVTREDVDKKIRSVMCYKSQKKKPYMTRGAITSLASVYGVASGVKYAEGFNVIRINE